MEMHSCEFEVGLLHSKFPGFRRAEIENYWLNILGKSGERPQGCILVATQVVEQSVDIDADFLITELAPTDMLLQRMGRQWRHAHTKRACTYPETVIVSGDPKNASDLENIYEILGVSNCKVYAPWMLCQTRFLWERYHEIELHRNLITIATYLIAKTGAALQTPKYLDKYFYEQTPVFEWDETGGEISIDGHETDFHYSHQKGLFRTKAFPSSDNACVSYSSEWEEIDVFDKSRFDW